MLGAVLSDFVLVGAVALGLGALLAASELAFSLLKWVGAAYLGWLGLRMLRSQGSLALPVDDAANAARRTGSQVFAKSFLVAVTNPKGYLFCSALLPQFIDPEAAQAPQYLLIGLLFAALDFAVMGVYAFVGARGTAAQGVGRALARPRLRRCAAGVGRLAGVLAAHPGLWRAIQAKSARNAHPAGVTRYRIYSSTSADPNA